MKTQKAEKTSGCTLSTNQDCPSVSECETCLEAAKNPIYGGYHMKCYGCRDRLLMNEPCKLYRETLAKMLEKYGGDVPDWRREPSCGCTMSCKRRQYIRQGKTDQKMVRYAYK